MTDRLRLEPVTTGHGADLHAVQADPWVAEWYAGAWHNLASRAVMVRLGMTYASEFTAEGLLEPVDSSTAPGEEPHGRTAGGAGVVAAGAVFALYVIGPDSR